jgi:hypothetical protein
MGTTSRFHGGKETECTRLTSSVNVEMNSRNVALVSDMETEVPQTTVRPMGPTSDVCPDVGPVATVASHS